MVTVPLPPGPEPPPPEPLPPLPNPPKPSPPPVGLEQAVAIIVRAATTKNKEIFPMVFFIILPSFFISCIYCSSGKII
jgi:hypothetical protein